MNWLSNISFSDIVTFLCGLFAFIYCIMQAGEKFFGNLACFQKLKEKKKAKEKTKLKELFEEFANDFADRYVVKIIDEIKRTDEKQNKKIDKLITSSNDILRKELVTIYYCYLPYKKIPVYIKKRFMKLYYDYHDQGGNSFIDEVFDEVKEWKVVETEEEATIREVKN